MLKEGQKAPEFELQADDGSTVRLADLRGKKVLLFFYPRADTPGCTIEACEFRDLEAEFAAKGALVFGISPDPVKDVGRFRSKFNLSYPLLADADHQVAERYGVWKEKSMFGKKYWGVERSTFVIDEQGEIAGAHYGVSPEGHAAEMLAAL
ncbi:MAG TPA: thioredoxin-dependent thiol peroxidase [Longimicrobiaceae bacterium]|nr:thioredoxin-dependent thiol peroxidase [Longimicrobiaceae bacterium]